MHWFGGSIAEAVTLSKQKNAIFVVFVEGDNDLSTEMSTVLDDGAVLKRLADPTNFLTIKLKSGSTDYTHFAQIYQFVPVPSLFFIGRNGTPLEVVCAGVQPDNLATRIDRILEEHHKDKPMQPSTSGQNIKQQTANLLQSEATPAASSAPAPTPAATPVAPAATPAATPATPAATPATPAATPATPAATAATPAAPAATPATPSAPAASAAVRPEADTSAGSAAKIQKMDDREVVCDGDVCVRRPRGPPGAGPSRGADAEPDQTQETPAPVEVKPTESAGSVEEKMARAKELIEAKKKEKEEKEKQLEKEKEKERRSLGQGVAELKRWQADQELKQIQEERKREKMENNLARQRILEQIAQDRAERRARDAAPPPAAADVAPPPTAGDGGGRARIQFKLPDGSSHTAHFDADGSLGDVQRYVADNLQLSSSQFSLWTAFPRRELSEPEATLRQLQLAPSAALLVLPRRVLQPIVRPAAVGGLLAFLTQLFTSMILQPSQQLYNWIMTRISPPPRSASPRPGQGTQGTQGTQGGVRRRGNVHRITGDAPDDDNNTWNGNSTQQM